MSPDKPAVKFIKFKEKSKATRKGECESSATSLLFLLLILQFSNLIVTLL